MKRIFMSGFALFVLILSNWGQAEVTPACQPFAAAIQLPQNDTSISSNSSCLLVKIPIVSNAVLTYSEGTLAYLNDTTLPVTTTKRMTDGGNINLLKVKQGDTLYLVIPSYYTMSIAFLSDLSESGETFEQAIRIFNGETNIPSGTQRTKWCKYVFPEMGTLVISSTSSALFAYKGKPTYNDIDQLKQMATDTQLLSLRITNKKTPLQVNGKKGDTVYFRICDINPDPNFPAYTDPVWKIWVNFQKSKRVVGYDRNNPFVLNLNETKEYPLLLPVFDTRYSIFRVDNPSGTAVQYKLSTNLKNFTVIDNKQIWDNRLPGQPYIFSVPANSSYIFIVDADTMQAPLSIRINLTKAAITDKISSYAQNILPISFDTPTKINFGAQPDITPRVKAPDDGFLFIESPYQFLPYIMFFRDSNRTVEYLNRNYPNAVEVSKDEIVYFTPGKHYADTITLKAAFLPGTAWRYLQFYYFSPNSDSVKTDYSWIGDTIKINLPMNYNGTVVARYEVVPGAKNSLDPSPFYNNPSFTLTDDTTMGTITYKGKSKKYYFHFNRRKSLLTGNQILAITISGQKGNPTIGQSKKEIRANVEALYSYPVQIILSPGAYISNFYNHLSDDTTVLKVFSENGDSTTYNIYLNIDSSGFDCANAIPATKGSNMITRKNPPYAYQYTASGNNAIVVMIDSPDMLLSMEVDTDCQYWKWLDGQGEVVFKGIQGKTYQILLYHPMQSFVIADVPYLKGNDILSVYMSRKYLIDRPNKTVWIAAEPNWSDWINLYVSPGAEINRLGMEGNGFSISLPDSVKITAMNGDTAWWYFRAMPLTKKPAFISYQLPIQIAPSQIDTTSHTIICFVPNTLPDTIRIIPAYELAYPQANVSLLSNPSTFRYSGYSIDTLIFANDTAMLSYVVTTAIDSQTWKVYVIRAKGSQIIAFNLDGQASKPEINHASKQISCLLLPYIDKTRVATYFTVASGCTVKAGGSAISNGDIVNYQTVSTLQIIKGNDTSTYQLSIKQLPKPCSAKFEYTLSNDTVYLRAINQKEGWIYYWDFGDKTNASLNYLTYHAFKPGIYNLSLTVYDPSSECIDTYVEKIEIGNVSPCKAMFSYSVQSSTRQVTLSNQSKGGTYFWSFDDGSFSTDVSPVKTYQKDGVYKVTLIATNADGSCKDRYTQTIFIGDSCDASFSYLVDTLSQTIKLYANFDYPGLQHSWLTGDGQILWGSTQELNLTRKGIYAITHTVVDNTNQCTDKVRASFEVGAISGDVEADFTILPDNTATKFINLSKGNPVKYVWNFGDGTLSTASNPSHTFNTQGTFTVCLTATSNKGVSNTRCKKVLSQPLATNNCVADFNYYIKPDSLQATCIDRSLGSISQYSWDFGDGNTSSLPSVKYSYESPNYYLVTHTVGNEQGCSDRILRLLNVGLPGALKCKFIYEQNIALKKAGGYPVDFIGAGLGDDVRIKWNFGDGTTDTTTLNPTHVYSEPGTYTVCFTVSDPITQQEDTYCQQVSVSGNTIRHINVNESWSIYPVPFEDYFEIQINNPSRGMVAIDLFDISGRKLATIAHKLLPAGWSSIRFDAAQLKSGPYIIQFRHSKGTEKQLIIKR